MPRKSSLSVPTATEALPVATLNLPVINDKQEGGPTRILARSPLGGNVLRAVWLAFPIPSNPVSG